jgi:hypothetical protein
MYKSVFGKEDIKKLSNPCTGPDSSRRLRLPDLKNIGMWKW